MIVSEAARLRTMEDENRRRKKLLTGRVFALLAVLSAVARSRYPLQATLHPS